MISWAFTIDHKFHYFLIVIPTLQSNLCNSVYSELCENIISRRNAVLDELCLCNLPLIVPFLLCCSVLGKTLPPVHSFHKLVNSSKTQEGLHENCLSIVSHGNSCICYVCFRYSNQWLYFTNWAILCKGGERIAMRFPLSRGGGETKLL